MICVNKKSIKNTVKQIWTNMEYKKGEFLIMSTEAVDRRYGVPEAAAGMSCYFIKAEKGTGYYCPWTNWTGRSEQRNFLSSL